MNGIFNLDEILLQWKKEYGTLTKSKKWAAEYYQIPINERFESLKALVKIIKDHLKSVDYFSNTTREKIVESCIPHKKSVSPSSYDMFKKGTRDHLCMAIIEVYAGEESKIEEPVPKTDRPFTKIFDPSRFKDETPQEKDEIDEEMALLLDLKDE